MHVYGGRNTYMGNIITCYSDYSTAMTNWEGKAKTAAVVAAWGASEPYQGKTDYAARLATDFLWPDGHKDGYVPGEGMLDYIAQHSTGLNYMLSHISGATPMGASNISYHSIDCAALYYSYGVHIPIDSQEGFQSNRYNAFNTRAVRDY